MWRLRRRRAVPLRDMSGERIVVAGAGAWGGWIALHLLRAGYRVTLVDPWGPGNARASSGDESRIVRANYGAAWHYVSMGARALDLWREFEEKQGIELVRRCGLLWLEGLPGEEHRESLLRMRSLGVKFEMISNAALRRRYPQLNADGFDYGVLEPDAGYAFARRSCRAVAEAFAAEGGVYRAAAVAPVEGERGSLRRVKLQDGVPIEADAFVFACGPWLPKVLPDVLGGLIRPTRQELFYFGEPARGGMFSEASMPAWIDHGAEFWYGIPGNEHRGFKIGDDARGADVDPTTQERVPSPAMIAKTRAYARKRFPGLADAPITEARVCQYENTPDNDFILDRHPALGNVWVAGGGSGHGFKHGPAIGEFMAGLVAGRLSVRSEFAFARFKA
jgi:sarcosine oxidase